MSRTRVFAALLTTAALALPAFAQQAPAAGAAAQGQQQPQPWKYKTAKLSRAQIDGWLAKPGQVLFLDVRRPDEVSKVGSFPVYLSIQVADVEKYLAFIPKDRSIITVSNHAGRAGAVGDLLASKGFKVAGAAGSETYEQEGGTITRIEPKPAPAAPAKS